MTFSRPDTRWIAPIVATAFFMEMLDGAIINTSLPQMALSFHTRPLDLNIGITVYLMSAAAFVPLSGWLADRYGARNIFLWAISIFTFSSLACGSADSLTQFTIARVFQGLGGALMTPVGRIVVLRNTQKSELMRATAIMTWPALLAPVIAPVLGGFIATYSTWRWNFLLNIPLGIAGLILVARFVPGMRDDKQGTFDWSGFALSALALITLLYGLESFTHAGEGSGWAVPFAFVIGGGVVAALAVRHLRNAKAPLVSLTSVAIQTFRVSTVTAGAAYRVSINATPFLLPLLFQVGFGLSAFDSGLLILAYFLGNIAMKPLTTRILRRFGFRNTSAFNGAIGGLAIMACSTFSMTTSRVWVVAVLLVAGMTRSMQFTAMNSLGFADVNPSQRSAAATLSGMLQQMVAVLGVAIGALLLHLSSLANHRSMVKVLDFRIAFVIVGLIALIAGLAFLRLPGHAGAEVSGHSGGRTVG